MKQIIRLLSCPQRAKMQQLMMAPEPQIPIGWALFIVLSEGKRLLSTTCEIAPEMPGHPQESPFPSKAGPAAVAAV